MPIARECKQCAVLWPEGWTRCPACKTMTQLTHRQPERTQSEAREADFERRYIEREERRISEGHLAPEGIGRREAQTIIELERRLTDEAA